jgi:redox-sensitive bicupin YhaK (pirin superfamily)
MTAGSGVVHSEMPEEQFLRSGGRMHGFQLWVNLPARDKMMKPRYQEVPGAKIPSAASADGEVRVRVIAGEAMGVRAVIDTRTPIFYLHWTLRPGARVEQPAPRSHNAFAYVVNGPGSSARNAGRVETVRWFCSPGTGEVAFEAAKDSPLDVLLVGGIPLGSRSRATGLCHEHARGDPARCRRLSKWADGEISA